MPKGVYKRKQSNHYTLENNFYRVTATNGEFLVSAESVSAIKKYNWYLHIRGYVYGTVDSKTVKLHRFLLNAKKDQIVDHINGQVYDNRLENLRLCSQAENCRNNNKLRKNKTSRYKGVSKCRSDYWVAQIQVNNKKMGLGYFLTEEDAATAYNKAAIKFHGEFASINDICLK